MKRIVFILLSCIAAATLARAQDKAPSEPNAHAGHMGKAAASSACTEAKPDCAATAEPFFDKDGRLWLAFSVADKVYAVSSADEGKSFAPPVTVASVAGGVIDANGEARPKIVAAKNGALIVSYTMRPEKSYEGTVFFARSTDGGKSFVAPTPMVGGGGQRFDIFGLSPNGRLYAAWLDKSDAQKAKVEGKEFAGSGIAVAWSNDNGASFEGKKILMDHSCECCRVAMAFDVDGLPVFAWRHVFDANMRDHYVAKLSADGGALEGARVSEDEWATTCPHHGPSLAIDQTGVRHVTWFAKGKQRQGLFYARSTDGGKSFAPPQKFGDDARAPSHAFILAAKGDVYRVWKEFDGATTSIALQASRDGGKSFGATRVVASTLDASDHPLLIEHKGVAYLSWLTRKEGYRLLPLPREQARAPRAVRSLAEAK